MVGTGMAMLMLARILRNRALEMAGRGAWFCCLRARLTYRLVCDLHTDEYLSG